MKPGITNPRTQLIIITVAIMLIGLGSAALIYFTAGNPPESTLVHEFENSKRYVHDLELYGGKMNVLADQFRRWFDSLWEGKSLAFMIALITIIISLACSFVASRLPIESRRDFRDEDDLTKTQ